MGLERIEFFDFLFVLFHLPQNALQNSLFLFVVAILPKQLRILIRDETGERDVRGIEQPDSLFDRSF